MIKNMYWNFQKKKKKRKKVLEPLRASQKFSH